MYVWSKKFSFCNLMIWIWCFTSVLVFGCWLMNHVTHLKLRQRLLLLKAEQIDKMETIYTQNDDFLKKLPFFWACNKHLFLSQLEIDHVIYDTTVKTKPDVEYLKEILTKIVPTCDFMVCLSKMYHSLKIPVHDLIIQCIEAIQK